MLLPLLLLALQLCFISIPLGTVEAVEEFEYDFDIRADQIIGAIANSIHLFRSDPSSWLAGNSTAGDFVTFRCRTSNATKFVPVTSNDDRNCALPIANDPANATANVPVAIVIHGWFHSHNRHWYRRIADAYQRHVGGTFCQLDWSGLALVKYSLAALNTRIVAQRLAEFVQHLRRCGVRRRNVTLIGHSFGAQIAGQAGGLLHGKIGRIFALDPAGWLFTKPQVLERAARLDRNDALYVQCVHTHRNLLGLGSGWRCGHQDYYPNDGRATQPGCESGDESMGFAYYTCSHFRSVQFFIAALDPANVFKARQCQYSYADWQNGLCAGNEVDFMGVHSRNRVAGTFFLQTAKQPPYALNA